MNFFHITLSFENGVVSKVISDNSAKYRTPIHNANLEDTKIELYKKKVIMCDMIYFCN